MKHGEHYSYHGWTTEQAYQQVVRQLPSLNLENVTDRGAKNNKEMPKKQHKETEKWPKKKMATKKYKTNTNWPWKDTKITKKDSKWPQRHKNDYNQTQKQQLKQDAKDTQNDLQKMKNYQ